MFAQNQRGDSMYSSAVQGGMEALVSECYGYPVLNFCIHRILTFAGVFPFLLPCW
jgi:hypothetical protein